jgi:hypothetical protein
MRSVSSCSLRLAATADFMLVKRARRELNDYRRDLMLPCLHSVAHARRRIGIVQE